MDFSLGGSVNFVGHHHSFDALLNGTNPAKKPRSNQVSVGNSWSTLELQMEKRSILQKNMCVESLPLAISNFNYSRMVGTLLYLAGHTRPNITYAINYAVKYIFCPMLVHKYDLKQIGCFLTASSDRGLVMKPSENLLKIESFPDATFVGMYKHEAMDIPICVKSRTGYVIVVANYLIILQSKLKC